MELLVHYLETDKRFSAASVRRNNPHRGIPLLSRSFWKLFKDILYTRIQLKLDMVVKHKRIVQLHIQIQKLGSMLHAV